MSSRSTPTADLLRGPEREARRQAVRALVRSALVSVLLIALYFAVPLTDRLVTPTGLLLVGGLVVLAVLLTWHLRSIVTSPYPRARAAAALTTSLTVFLVLFSSVYVLMSRSDPGSFSEPLSRLDAAYFTITVFATVGFGDIIPLSSAARGVTTVQMLGDVVLVGVVARLVVGAVRRGLERRPDPPSSPPDPKETSP